MKAAVLREVNKPLEIEDIQHGDPAPREVLVRTVAAGVCHSDLHFQNGSYPYPLPSVLGHESAGVVEAVGSMVDYVKPGDHVITCLSAFCGHCEDCLTGHMSLCQEPELQRHQDEPPRIAVGGETVHQFLNLSSFAEYMLIHEHALTKIREDMPMDRAALIGCGVTTGVGAVIHTAGVEPGSTVVVIGCGGVGLSCIQGAAIAGAPRVVAVDMLADKLELVRSFGATDLVDASQGGPLPQVKDLLGGGVDYSFECVGNVELMGQALACTARGWGESIIIGVAGGGEEIHARPFLLVTGRSWRGSAFGGVKGRTELPKYVDRYMAGRIKLDEMVTETRPLEEINTAFDRMHDGEVIRTVINLGG